VFVLLMEWLGCNGVAGVGLGRAAHSGAQDLSVAAFPSHPSSSAPG